MDQSVPSPTDSLGEEGFQLSWATPLRLRHYLLAQVRGLETSSNWLISSVHVYDSQYWEHLCLVGIRELQYSGPHNLDTKSGLAKVEFSHAETANSQAL